MFCAPAVFQPLVTNRLLDKLREVFPGEARRGMTVREIDHVIGQQEVIDYLFRLQQIDDDIPNLSEDL